MEGMEDDEATAVRLSMHSGRSENPLDSISKTVKSSSYIYSTNMDTNVLSTRSPDAMSEASEPALLPRESVSELAQLNNFSSKSYDQYVLKLQETTTGCIQPGAVPLPLALNDTCELGWYCINSSDEYPPQFCPPTIECQGLRMNKMTCSPQGVYEPRICNNGFYCPAGGKQEIPCPKGTFCPTGSHQPFNCSAGALCGERSEKQLLIAPLIGLVIIDIVLLLLIVIGYGISKWRKKHHVKYTTLDQVDTNGANTGLLRAAAQPGTASTPPTNSPPRSSHPQNSPYIPFNPDLLSPPTATHRRRASGRVDNMDGYADDDADSIFESPIEDEFDNSPELQRFIRSMTKSIETSSIGLSFDFEHLSFETKKHQRILLDVTGHIPRGSFLGIMGGSGAGKTTFVNTLMGKQRATSGKIKVNGWEKDMSKYKKLIGYVPQDDIVFPELTVRENILHSARCRLPRWWRDNAIQDHVDSLIACLQLTHVQHRKVGDETKPVISGGQRKRVNIGMELAAAPMAIFLDEPTSGLDATSASSVMRLLRAISRLGVTTIAIVHQPREKIFHAFDRLLILAEGHSVYSGPTDDVQRYFESLNFVFPHRGNPADTLIDITTGDGAQYTLGGNQKGTNVATLITEWKIRGPEPLHDRHLTVEKHLRRSSSMSQRSFNSTVEQEQSLTRTMKARGASWHAQVTYCFYRAMTQQVRNSTSFFFEIGVGALAGIVIGLSAFASGGHLFQGIYQGNFSELSSAVDYQSTPQLGLLGGLAIGLAASAPGFWVFGEEKLMYWRETAAGHSRSAYYVGKLLSTLLRIALSAFHFTVFMGVLATPLISFPLMYVANVLYFWCVYGLASIVSMLVKRQDGPLIAVLTSLIIGILGGVAPPLKTVDGWGLGWFWRLSPGVWFTEAYFTENLTPLAYLYQLDLAEQYTGFTLGQYALDVAMLFVIGFVYRVIAFPLLIFVHRNKQRIGNARRIRPPRSRRSSIVTRVDFEISLRTQKPRTPR